MSGHNDVVRCGTISQHSPDVWVTGSYDHSIKLWDVRTRENVNSFNHGAPVEDVLTFPNGSVVVSAGGPTVKIWDTLSGRVIQTLENHQKTVTCLAIDFTNRRLFSAGLDHMLKIYSLNTYQVTYTMKYIAPILSLGISPRDTHVVAGMSDGLLQIKHRSKKFEQEPKKKKSFPKIRNRRLEIPDPRKR